ncbi:hypothetical protein [Streptomyces sp. CA-106110]|uniref:hypothetical protein n=1 Tax=Streptomyces sp. CA-106110 TaxID=3240044 RepID=UPI003D934181
MDFNPDQFRQPGPGQRTFRGFGDQAMRHYRVTPPTPQDSPPPRTAPGGHQGSLFQASEVNGPTPDPTFNASQFRTAQHALPAMSNAAMRSQRVTPPTPPQAPAPAPAPEAPSGWVQPELPDHPDPSAVPDLTPPTPPATPAGPGRQVKINDLAYRTQGLRFGPAPEPEEPAPSAVPPRPTTPAHPPMPPSAASTAPSRISPGAGTAARRTGAGVFVAAKALQSLNRPATDPKRSGTPLHKSSQGWMRS